MRQDAIRPGDVVSWNEVSEVHRVQTGIYHRNGRLISLLTDFGRLNPCYPDRQIGMEGTIRYTGNGRRGDQKLDAANRALFDAIETAHAVPLFNKLAVGRWEFVGFFLVLAGEYVFDEERDRMVWKFTLQPVPTSRCLTVPRPEK